jgi:TetR/AcrR family transcriptional regulator, fatty acid metabolism regulator protein
MNSSHKERSTKSDKRKAILQSAWKLIRHYGYAKTTIDDIAQSAGVGKGTVYLHFGSKSDIMLALVELTNDRITKQLEKLAAGDAPPAQRLHECLQYRVMTLFDLVHRYPHSADVVSLMLTDIVERLDRYVRRHGELLGEIVEQGCTQGIFSVDDPAKTGNLLAGMFELLTPPYYRFSSRIELEQFATSVFELAINGIATTNIVIDEKTS